MTAHSSTRDLRDEAGFTLVELLVAMVISTVLIFAILETLDSFSSNAARQTRITDANEQVRTVMDRVVSDLRQAATVEVAGANDLVYTITDSATATRRERICLDSSSRLWRSSVTTATPPAVPIAAGTVCPTAGSGASQITSLFSANTAANPMFRYDSATAASVRSVGLTFALKAVTTGAGRDSTLRSSAFVRVKAEAASAITGSDLTTACSSGQPLLTLAAGVGPVTVTYTDTSGASLGSASSGTGLLLPASASTVIATITNAGGIVTQLVKSLTC